MRYIAFLLFMVSTVSMAQIGSKTSRLNYYRGTVGAAAIDAIADNLVGATVYGWNLCHDSDSLATYIVASENADPAVDGMKLAQGKCFDCTNCNGGTLRRLQVKGSGAGATFSILMMTP